MSVQFGKCNFDGKPVDPKDLDQVRPILAPYGPDGEGYLCKNNFGVLYRAFHTTKESRREVQPYVSARGAVITWDGRLDNREELIHELGSDLPNDSTDLAIVAAAYEALGTNCFAKLIGDWALSIWEPQNHVVILAKDFAGTRQLYYSVKKDQVLWCTLLDPLVTLPVHSHQLEEEYIAGWLGSLPAPNLTPYVGVRSVPACGFTRLEKGRHTVIEYWDFDPRKTIRHRSDNEYEEHFRIVFSESVRRRLRADAPVLAELSGGIDSSSIVCIGDMLQALGKTEAPRLDTISYFDLTEPNWDELPYVAMVEKQRGRIGSHIDVHSAAELLIPEYLPWACTPGNGCASTPAAAQFAATISSGGNRILLSGLGGDEVLGGVPTPIPELATLLAAIRIFTLARQLVSWALSARKPMVYLLAESAAVFLPVRIAKGLDYRSSVPWIRPSFAKKHWAALHGYPTRTRLFGPSPSFQQNLQTFEALRRQLGTTALPSGPLFERRYPYLDRDLLEFVYAIPREQVVRPHQRRSLMRRALGELVPREVLWRRRKASVSRAPLVAVSSQWNTLHALTERMQADSMGIVDKRLFVEFLRRMRDGRENKIIPMLRTLTIESWLRSVTQTRPVCDENAILSSQRLPAGIAT